MKRVAPSARMEQEITEALRTSGDPLGEAALAVCGFGWRADAMHNAEFDPAGRTWATPMA